MEFNGYLFNKLNSINPDKLVNRQSLFFDGVYECQEIDKDTYLLDNVESLDTQLEQDKILGQEALYFDTDRELALHLLKNADKTEPEWIDYAKALLEEPIREVIETEDDINQELGPDEFEDELEDEFDEPLIWTP